MTERDGECRVWSAEPVPAVVTDYAWPAGLGSLEIALAESSLFSPFFHVCMPLQPPEPEVPTTPCQFSETESGPSLGQCTLCKGKADRLYPKHMDRSAHCSGAGGVAVLAKLPGEPGVQLLLQMLHLEWSLQGSFRRSLQTRAGGPMTA